MTDPEQKINIDDKLAALNLDKKRHGHFRIKICVSGAAELDHLNPRVHDIGKELGRQIILQGADLTTGSTTGFPFWAAMGAKDADGLSIGFSPARNEKEHVQSYRLPIDFMDIIIYTGFGYPGRDLFLTRASDAVIIGPGRIGTFHEFTIAFEDSKPIGVLTSDDWETDDIIKTIIEKSNRKDTGSIVFDSDPKALVEKVIEATKKMKVNDTYCDRVF
ncbi:MAG: hypothetical protein WCV55_01745 [Candidatus Paceibacterota bacterium]